MVHKAQSPSHNSLPGAIVLLPCNGVSARGRLSRDVALLLQEQMDDVDVIFPVPLAAGIPDTMARFASARYVLGLAGCEQQCQDSICAQSTGVDLDASILLGDALREDISAYEELSEEERGELRLLLSSRVLAKISEID